MYTIVRPYHLLTCLLLVAITATAQNTKLQTEITNDIWKPFIASFNNRDDKAFQNLHSHDIVRVIRDNKQILEYSDYFSKRPDSLINKAKIWKRSIEFRFFERIATNDKAFEGGYFKTTTTNDLTGENRIGYGKFYVVLRKEKGKWKILVDADANEGTTEKVFLSGYKME